MKVTVKWHGAEVSKTTLNHSRIALRRVGQFVTNHIKRKISGPRRPPMTLLPAYEPPHVDTGRLRNSIFWDMPDDMTVQIGTTLLYGLYLELGGTVVPKTKGALAIPISERAKNHSRTGASARDFPIPLKKIPTQNGALLVEEKISKGKGQKSDIILHYFITDRVDRAPHPFIVPSLEECIDSGAIERIFADVE